MNSSLRPTRHDMSSQHIPADRSRIPRRGSSRSTTLPLRHQDIETGHPDLLAVAKKAFRDVDTDIETVLERDKLRETDETLLLQEYYDSVSPIMVEELLRAIANDDELNPHLVLNTRKKQIYPTAAQLRALRDKGRLTPELCDLLTHELEDDEAYRRRNMAAHPNGSNGRFAHQAGLLELHTPGWIQACREFVESKKGRAAGFLALSDLHHIYSHRNFPWNPDDWSDDGRPHDVNKLQDHWLDIPTAPAALRPSRSASSAGSARGITQARPPSVASSTLQDWHRQRNPRDEWGEEDQTGRLERPVFSDEEDDDDEMEEPHHSRPVSPHLSTGLTNAFPAGFASPHPDRAALIRQEAPLGQSSRPPPPHHPARPDPSSAFPPRAFGQLASSSPRHLVQPSHTPPRLSNFTKRDR
ncbi:hypothetical protein JCM8547_000596 [Rhodosporidiobolus lusitaniae]